MEKYWLITYGCQMNKSDSERIASVMQKKGYKKASKIESADLLVINACSVRQSAVDRVYAKVNKCRKTKRIILTGCILKKDKENLKNKVAEFWQPGDYFECQPIRQDKSFAYLPIMTGCDNFCSYCVVPYTRGREKSRAAEEIVKEAESLIEKGRKEIVLLGQNVNSYRDSNTNFPELLKEINDIEGEFKLSFITSHPKDMSDELIGTMAKCEKLTPCLNLPVQSGDNRILKKMNRQYTANRYKNLIKKIRKKMPEIKISTDIIVGFPGETKKQFQNTVALCKEIKFDKAYISRYSSRVGTAAFKLKDDVSPQEKKRRWQILENLINK
jgi:tRNA-2-methylthio-N6-dimethylallyladenosine synthase